SDLTRMRRCDLYQACLSRLLSGQWRDAPRKLSKAAVDGKLELLEHVAFRLFVAEKEMFSPRELRQVLRESHTDLHHPPMEPEKLDAQIEEWSEQDGVLVQAGADEKSDYLFL